jgi:hypothetical protein
MNESVSRAEVRRTVRNVVSASDSDSVPRQDVIGVASQQQGVTPDDVDNEIDALERAGFIYIVNGEVKLP